MVSQTPPPAKKKLPAVGATGSMVEDGDSAVQQLEAFAVVHLVSGAGWIKAGSGRRPSRGRRTTHRGRNLSAEEAPRLPRDGAGIIVVPKT